MFSKILSAMTLILSVNVFAQSNTGPQPAPPLSPIRNATAKVAVIKTSVVPVTCADPAKCAGQFTFKTEVVCIQTIDTPVYDTRPQNGSMVTNDSSCSSTWHGVNVDIHFSAFIELGNFALFPGEQLTDAKQFVTNGYVSSPLNSAQPPQIPGASAVFRGLDQKEVILDASPNIGMEVCSSLPKPTPVPNPSPRVMDASSGNGTIAPPTNCSVQEPEIFSIQYDIVDTP